MDTDILSPQRNTQVAIGFALQALAGQSTVLDGLILTPTSPASLTVNVGPGSIMSLGVIDATSYGSLVANLAPLVKQGINTTSTSFTLSAPPSSGQSTNYLIQAQVLESDQIPVVLPYYNASNPAQPYSGPANAGTSQNTQRNQRVQLQLKAGAPAPAGTQTTPAVDAGWIGLYVITVSFGQSQITSANLTNSLIRTAPFVDPQRLGRGVLPGRLLSVQTFASHGTFTYTPTAGTNLILVSVQGAGGGGGAAQGAASSSAAVGGGGSSGSFGQSILTAASFGTSQIITVGTGGGGGTTGGDGSNGGTSSFGTFVSAPGGIGGQGGAAVNVNAIRSAGGVAATASGGNILNSQGEAGRYGLMINPTGSFFANGGAGGRSFYAGGGGPTGADTNGAIGLLGSGGSGGCTSNNGSGTGHPGGAGGDGVVVIEEHS